MISKKKLVLDEHEHEAKGGLASAQGEERIKKCGLES
jgi:hypothetical protein